MIQATYISGTPNAERRSCHDCRHCQAAVSWWCVNPQAREARGTPIPGEINCPFWEPILSWEEVKAEHEGKRTWWDRLWGLDTGWRLDFIRIRLPD
jgi:hypothetical protein